MTLIYSYKYYSTIGVLLFEKFFDTTIITGLTAFGVNYDEVNNEEKNMLLRSSNLNITCPQIMKLTTITLELVKIFKSDRLLDFILNIIRRNLLNKKTNINCKTVSKIYSRHHLYNTIESRIKNKN